MKKFSLTIFSMVLIFSFIAIGAGFIPTDPQEKDPGIGPVKDVVLGPLDKKMTDQGKSIFNSKCIICHDLDQAKIGPPLRNVTKVRTPEYIMNLLVNTVQMQKENATIKALIKKYNNVIMIPPLLNQEQARTVLEYLRSVAK
jgi:mono/diheme cytochrome c family protein